MATGAVWAAIRHRPAREGLTRGLLGGGVMSLGRQVAGTHRYGSGLAGREVSAVGIALTTSSGDSNTTVPVAVGPFTVILGRHTWDWRLNITNAIETIVVYRSANTRLDLGLTLSAGAPVFRDRRRNLRISTGTALGSEGAGVVLLARNAFARYTGDAPALYHESVHVLQEDYLNDAVALPMERGLLRRTSLGRRLALHFDVGLITPELYFLASPHIPYRSQPWEREAFALSGTGRH
ncbi:MAG: hypothetical protein ACR2MQ_02110 [Gemmatimonadaceae bacterium]